MIDLNRSLRMISGQLAGQTYDLYVVDASMRVVLFGRAVEEIAPPATEMTLPPDVAATLAMLAHDHDFARERIAGARTNALRAMRVVKIVGPAGEFFGVLSVEPAEHSP